MPRLAGILVHAADQVLGAVEFHFRPDPADEGDVEGRAIKVAGEIEQEDLEQHRAVVERGAPAEARHSVIARAADADPHRIDAVLEAAIRAEPEVRGRVAERAPALVAMLDLRGDEIRKSQQFGRLRDVPSRQRIAHRAGGDAAALVLERRHHIDRKAVVGALRHQEIRRAAPRLAEMEVEADHRAADGEPVHQDAFDKLLGAEAGQRGVEIEQDCAVEPGRGEQPELGDLGREVERRLVRAEEGPRMRLEGQHRRRPVRRLGAPHRHGDHRAVAAMDAVEVADGDDRPVQPVEAPPLQIGALAAHDDEGVRGVQVGHGGVWSRSKGYGPSVNDTLTDLAAIPGLITQSSTLNRFFNLTLLPFPVWEGGVQ